MLMPQIMTTRHREYRMIQVGTSTWAGMPSASGFAIIKSETPAIIDTPPRCAIARVFLHRSVLHRMTKNVAHFCRQKSLGRQKRLSFCFLAENMCRADCSADAWRRFRLFFGERFKARKERWARFCRPPLILLCSRNRLSAGQAIINFFSSPSAARGMRPRITAPLYVETLAAHDTARRRRRCQAKFQYSPDFTLLYASPSARSRSML